MPRTMRMEYPGAIYRVMDRAIRQEQILVNARWIETPADKPSKSPVFTGS
jgi:hypothetical protein